MKECCKTGDKDPGLNMKKWIIRILWTAALLLVLGVGLIQIFNR